VECRIALFRLKAQPHIFPIFSQVRKGVATVIKKMSKEGRSATRWNEAAWERSDYPQSWESRKPDLRKTLA